MARQKMPLDKRAAQFLPFQAVKGLDEALLAKEKIVVEKIQLSEESLKELDIQMHKVQIFLSRFTHNSLQELTT